MIEIKNLSVAYSQAGTVLKSISMTLRHGEFAVLLGRSGAGKSSLLRAINYLVRPSAGSISVAGVGELDNPRSLLAHRRQTGMVFQHHQLILRLSSLDNVLIGCLGRYSAWRSLGHFRRTDVELALDCLQQVGLSDHALRRADELSGGERQRLGIARALAQQPQLLLVDEPVASLDPQTADRMMVLLRDICKTKRLTAAVSLHQLELARRYADRIVGLSGGQVVFDAAPCDLTDGDLNRIYGRTPDAVNDLSPSPKAPPGAPVSGLINQECFEHEMLVQDD